MPSTRRIWKASRSSADFAAAAANEKMNIKDLFKLAVRIIGVVVLVYGAYDLMNSLLFYNNYFVFPEMTTGYYLISGLLFIAIGIYFVRGAAFLVDFAFPEDDLETNEEETADLENNS